MPPSGLPDAYLDGGEDPLGWILRRFARGRGPLTTDEALALGLEPARVEALLSALDLVRGELRPGGSEREWCDPDVLRRVRRASLARLRRRWSPSTRARSADSFPAGKASTGATLREALVALQGLSLPVALWESDEFPRRVPGYQPAWLDQLTASGEVVVGAGLERVALYFGKTPSPPAPGGAPPPTRRRTGPSARCSRPGRCSGSTSSRRPASRERSRFPPFGTSSGRAR